MARPTEFPDDVFIRMPPDTKRKLKLLAGIDPDGLEGIPAAWLRRYLIEHIDADLEARGLILPPKEAAE